MNPIKKSVRKSTIRQLALPLETHRNHFLFSDHYLNELLPRQPVWREVEAGARQALAAITELYHQKAGAHRGHRPLD